MRPIIGRTKYPLDVIELEPHEEVGFDGFVVQGFPVKHRVEAYGYAFIEDDRPGRFDVETAATPRRHPGPDFGRLQRGETVNGVTPEQVMGEDRPGRRIVYSGDTMPCQTTEVYAHDADVLIHEATFCEDEKARARETGPQHRPAGRRSSRATPNVKLLALTHLSTRYFPREIRDEARAVFENTVVPRDFDAIEVPFPERGEPHLVKTELESRPVDGLALALVLAAAGAHAGWNLLAKQASGGGRRSSGLRRRRDRPVGAGRARRRRSSRAA